jgi:hypothetical protein
MTAVKVWCGLLFEQISFSALSALPEKKKPFASKTYVCVTRLRYANCFPYIRILHGWFAQYETNVMFSVPRRKLTKVLYLQSATATTKLVFVVRIQMCSNISNKLTRKLMDIAATVTKLSGHHVYILHYVHSVTYITALHCIAYDGL